MVIWLLTVLGVHIEAGQYSDWYNFWSGIGSDIGEITLVFGVVTYWRSTRCHIDGCYRHGHYTSGPYKLCRLHHPNVPEKVTHKHIKKFW